MKPLRPRYSRIRRLTGELLDKSSIKIPPVPVDKIAASTGAQIVYRNFNQEISGALIRRGTSAIIAVADEQVLVRQRFTIAHELGHLLLHPTAEEEVHVDKHFNVRFRSPASSTAEDIAEIEANAFAAALLMPEEWVRRDTRRMNWDFDDAGEIRSLAERYEVSTQAMTFRLANLFDLSISG
jgi:Zn-dependent peptidase ImmA (M78 family)